MMAIDYVRAGSEFHKGAVSHNTPPVSIFCWVFPEGSPVNVQVLFSINNDTSSQFLSHMTMRGDLAGDPIEWTNSDGSTNTNPRTINGFISNKWNSFVGVAYNDNNHICVLNADWANRGIDITNSAGEIPGANTTTIGRAGQSSPGAYFEGKIAYVTIWDIALTQQEIESLHIGKHPLLIRPENITNFWPLLGDGPVNIRARDIIGKINLDTVGGTPTKVDSLKLRVPRFF